MKKLFILFALFAHVVAAQTVPNYVPTNGLVGWWPFNGNANDLSGNGNNGVVSGPALSTDRNGINNSCYLFGANTSNSISISNLSLTNDWTIATWFMQAPTHISSQNYLIGLKCSGQLAGIGQSFNSPLCGIPAFRNFLFDGDQGCSNWVSANLSFQVNTWQFIGVTYSNGVYKVYFPDSNGNMSVSSSSTLIDLDITNIIVGKRCSGPQANTFNGKIDDISIWNRALTLAEIQTLYLGCADTLAQNPTSATATVGTNATFTTLSSASGATYQWQAKNGSSFVNVSNAGQFSGATSSTLTVTSVSSANNGLQVRCIVDHGDCVDTSDIAVLTSCFSLTAQPLDQYVVAGSSANFTAATNDPACTFQWQTNAGFGFQNLSNAGQFSGVTSATLSVSGVSQANNNQLFRCLVSAGTCLETTASAKIVLSGVGVSENSLQRVSVSPNPTRGSVDLGVALEGTYTLIGIDGRAVQTGTLRQVLDFSNQPSGVYSLRLETAAGSRVLKVVKE
jgi:hypothetical protein